MRASIALQVLPKAENDKELCRMVDEVIAYIKFSRNFFLFHEDRDKGQYEGVLPEERSKIPEGFHLKKFLLEKNLPKRASDFSGGGFFPLVSCLSLAGLFSFGSENNKEELLNL